MGFVGELNREPSRQCVTDALEMMMRYLSEQLYQVVFLTVPLKVLNT